jgi:hypothetical protein
MFGPKCDFWQQWHQCDTWLSARHISICSALDYAQHWTGSIRAIYLMSNGFKAMKARCLKTSNLMRWWVSSAMVDLWLNGFSRE